MKKQSIILIFGLAIFISSCAAPNSRAFHNRTNKMMSLDRTR